MKGAIYHFTNGSEKRPGIYKEQLNILEQFATSQGYIVKDIYCDKSLKKCEQSQLTELLDHIEDYDVLVTKDFYHISKNTMKCMSVMTELRNKGIKIHTIDNGYFTWEDVPTEQPLKIATYCCRFGQPNIKKQIIQLQNDILSLFANKKTNWTVVDQYYDESKNQNDGEQPQLMKLISNKDKYDLILVHNLNDIHWRTARFCKIRQQFQLDIYSLQDGFLKYTQEG